MPTSKAAPLALLVALGACDRPEESPIAPLSDRVTVDAQTATVVVMTGLNSPRGLSFGLESGFKTLTDLAFGPDGSLYVVQFGSNPTGLGGPGLLIRVAAGDPPRARRSSRTV